MGRLGITETVHLAAFLAAASAQAAFVTWHAPAGGRKAGACGRKSSRTRNEFSQAVWGLSEELCQKICAAYPSCLAYEHMHISTNRNSMLSCQLHSNGDVTHVEPINGVVCMVKRIEEVGWNSISRGQQTDSRTANPAGAPYPARSSDMSSSQLETPSAVIAQTTWARLPGLNCWWYGHGAEEVDLPLGSSVAHASSLPECKAACLEEPACEGFLMSHREQRCYRKRGLVIERCETDQPFDLYVWSRPKLSIGAGTSLPSASHEPWDYRILGRPEHGPLTVGKCDALLRNPNDILWPMWGHLTKSGGKCFGDSDAESLRFFNSVLDGRQCDVNWITGSAGEVGQREARPLNGPTMFGFDSAIYAECARARGLPTTGWKHETHQLLVDICRPANFNFIRLLDGSWNLCRNLEYQLCAINGLLPGQPRLGTIVFAKPPHSLTLEDVRASPEPGSGDILIMEVCLFSHLCKNRDELFRVRVMEPFYCDLDIEAYWELPSMLRDRTE